MPNSTLQLDLHETFQVIRVLHGARNVRRILERSE